MAGEAVTGGANNTGAARAPAAGAAPPGDGYAHGGPRWDGIRWEGPWDLVSRPRRTSMYAWIAAAVVVVVAIVSAALMTEKNTGVHFRIWDQLSLVVLGLFIAAGLLLFARPRLRAGARGVAVRNVVGEKYVEWDLIERITFPPGARFARIDLPDDEYLPVLAIQINDRARAVQAIKEFRALQRRYRGPAGEGGETPRE